MPGEPVPGAGPQRAGRASAGRWANALRRHRLQRLAPLAALALGVLQAQAFAPPRGLLQWFATTLVFLLIDRAPGAWRAAVLGFAFGCGWFGVGLRWLYISMHVYGPMPGWMAATATMAVAAMMALYPALGAAVAWRSVRGPARLLLALPAAWALADWLRGVLFTGFPWLAGGYAQVDSALAGYAPLAGVYGVTLAAALASGAAACAVRPPAGQGGAACHQRAARRAGWLLGAIGVLVATGAALRAVAWTQPSGAPIVVRLVQGNIAQDDKFAASGMQVAAETYLGLMRGDNAGNATGTDGGHVDLVALPESVFPVAVGDLPDGLLQALQDYTVVNHSALVFGIFVEQPAGHYYNSALGLSGDGHGAQRYSKRHLVPFGEFIPPGFRWFVDLMQIPIGDQERGAAYQPPMHLAGQQVAVNICFEDLFGAEIIDAWRDPALEPTLLLNLSNLAWFDDSAALPQHLQIARMRTLETGRPMLRATNTGVTAIIDPRGVVTAMLPVLTAASLERPVQGYRGRTPFVRAGNRTFLALALLLLGAAWAWSIRGSREALRQPQR